MQLHDIPVLVAVNSVAPMQDGALLVNIRAIIEDAEEDVDYVLRFDDRYGLAPTIRAAIGWTERDAPPV